MANQFSIEEAVGGATPPPSKSFSADEALAESTPVSTPQTTAALNETETLSQQLGRVIPAAWRAVKPAGQRILDELHKPSPAWLQPFEKSVKDVAATPFLPSAQDVQSARQRFGLPDQPAAGSHLMETLYEPVRKAATLENAAIAASWIQPEIGAAVTSAYLAPSVVPAAKQIARLPQMTPEEGLQLGMEVWPIVAAPFIHGPKPAFTPSEFTGFPMEGAVKPDVPPTAAEAMKVKGVNVAPGFTAKDVQTQKVLSDTKGMFSDQNLAEHFPDHELDDLQQMGVISDAGNGYFTVNPPGTKPAPSLPPDQQALVNKVNEGLAAGEVAPTEPAQPSKTPQEIEEEHRLRLEEVEDRMGIYGVKPINTEGMTTEEAMKVLEAQEEAIPYAERLGSIRSGKTLQENRISLKLRNQWLEQRKGTMGETDLNRLAWSIPEFDVTKEPGGGFRVRTSPYEEAVEIPPEGKGRPTIQRRTVPPADFFLDREGGELQPYASRVRSTETVGVRSEGEKVGEKAPLRQQRPAPGPRSPGTQPKPASERPVAPETPPKVSVPTRYVVRETNKGAVIRDLETDKVVGKQEDFQSSALHPTPEELSDLRQRAQRHAERLQQRVAEESKPEPPKEEPSPETTFKVRAPKDEFANSPTTPVATAVSEMGGILSRNTAKKRGKLEGNEALWNDLPKLADISHNKIYQQGGEMPDVMAQSLYDAGLISEPTVGEMYRSLEAESQGTRGRAKAEKASAASRNVMEKQAERFGREQRKESEEGAPGIPASSLKVGDTVKVGDTKLKVTEIDPQEHLVTLENGRKYGIQEVNDDDVIFGEHLPEQKSAPAAASLKQPPPGISAEPSNLPPATAGKGRIWQRRQSDPMRYQHRDEPGLWLELNKDKGGYDVVDYRGGKRNVFDFIGGSDARAKVQAKWSHGRIPPAELLEPELSHISDFEREIKNKFGKDLTSEEKQKLAPIIKEINEAKGKSVEKLQQQFNKVIEDHYKNTGDMSFDDAMKGIEDAITQALKDCGT
jgi:hypothetical protein